MSTETESGDDLLFWARVGRLLEEALSNVPSEELQRRAAWCRETGEHGVTAFAEADTIRFMWGGGPLLVVARDVFDDDAYFEPLLAVVLPNVPDDASGLTEG